jgi:hypothetical protein
MAEITIKVPGRSGDLSVNVNDKLYIEAESSCNFCCNIGDNFNPTITHLSLAGGTMHGPYTAHRTGTGKYNTSHPGTACNPTQDTTLTPKSIQIS